MCLRRAVLHTAPQHSTADGVSTHIHTPARDAAKRPSTTSTLKHFLRRAACQDHHDDGTQGSACGVGPARHTPRATRPLCVWGVPRFLTARSEPRGGRGKSCGWMLSGSSARGTICMHACMPAHRAWHASGQGRKQRRPATAQQRHAGTWEWGSIGVWIRIEAMLLPPTPTHV